MTNKQTIELVLPTGFKCVDIKVQLKPDNSPPPITQNVSTQTPHIPPPLKRSTCEIKKRSTCEACKNHYHD